MTNFDQHASWHYGAKCSCSTKATLHMRSILGNKKTLATLAMTGYFSIQYPPQIQMTLVLNGNAPSFGGFKAPKYRTFHRFQADLLEGFPRLEKIH